MIRRETAQTPQVADVRPDPPWDRDGRARRKSPIGSGPDPWEGFDPTAKHGGADQ